VLALLVALRFLALAALRAVDVVGVQRLVLLLLLLRALLPDLLLLRGEALPLLADRLAEVRLALLLRGRVRVVGRGLALLAAVEEGDE